MHFPDLRTFLLRSGVVPEVYWVYRDGVCVYQAMQGYVNSEKVSERRYIGLWPNSDVRAGDILENATSRDRYRIVETENHTLNRQVFQLKAFYLTEYQYQQQQLERQRQPQNVFNIDTAFNSIIGGEGNIVVNYTAALSDLEKRIAKTPSPDNEQLKELISVLREALDGGNQVEQGLLSRFASVLQRNSWASSPIASAILSWLFTGHH